MLYEDESIVMANLVLLLCLRLPKATAMHLHRYWNLNPVTREYDEPSYAELQAWVKEARGPNQR